jgi:hypothetical protein
MTPMACSTAQLESNRRNAQLSSGPKTPDGKAHSRANGLKHGLTGSGIVLPTEDAEEVDRRFADLEAEMKPNSVLARQLVLRVALLTVRLERSAEHEAKAISHRMRKARAEFDEARLAEVEGYFSKLAAEPATNARRLRGSPEGIDLLVEKLEALRADLVHPDGMRWGWLHCERLHLLLGRQALEVPATRARAFTEGIVGNFAFLKEADGAGLKDFDRQLWSLAALVDLIDREIAALKDRREGLDLEGLELDRSEAASRAIFDASPAATLARKYEAAAERGLYRALREFREVQAEIPQIQASSGLAADPPEELGSSFPQPSGEGPVAPEAETPAVEARNDPISASRPRRSRRASGREGRKAALTGGDNRDILRPTSPGPAR